MHHLRFRQVHLDFHTSPAIPRIGAAFDKAQWQDTLQGAHVNSITLFSKCHHGWTYHETKVGQMHPHLKFDLLRAQFDACKEIDINAPVYLSAGLDTVMAEEHPEWRMVDVNGKMNPGAGEAGFHLMCFNSPYLDYLCEQIREAARLFPNCDGIFLDIIHQGQCCCRSCMAIMEREGLDVRNPEHRAKVSAMALDRYYRESTAAAKCDDPDMPIFHNSGHIRRGKRDILKYFSHLELESLPTGGWGYDHFPLSAKYCKGLDLDFLGMTGKFHTTWGEFGGFKHPNALRYECAAMMAFGSKCSVGDQLHPEGALDKSTYSLIGQAYAEVETKEPWCIDTTNVADIGLLSAASFHGGDSHGSDDGGDVGAGRILLEGHYLFDVIDSEMDFGKYKMLILPDSIKISDSLKGKLDLFLAAGGKMMLTGESGLKEDGSGFAFDLGADWSGKSEFSPDYVKPRADLSASFVDSPVVMYLPSQRIKVTNGESLGVVHDPYFNRDYSHFCSHQHAPARPEASGFDCGAHKGNIMYLAHPVFSIYRGLGAVPYKEYALKAIEMLLGADKSIRVNMPSTGRISLMEQKKQGRAVLHLLHAATINRGGPLTLSGGP